MIFYQHTQAFGDSILKKYNPNHADKAALNMCELFKSDWDSIIVVPAYVNYGTLTDEYDFANFKSVKSGLNATIYRDDITTLLFIKRKRIVRYDRIWNVPITFSSLVESSNSPVIKRNPCTILFINKVELRNVVEYRMSNH